MAEHLTPEKIEQGRKLLHAASPPPWEVVPMQTCFSIKSPHGRAASVQSLSIDRRDAVREVDASLIAWLRNSAPALLDAAELGMAWEAEAKAARKVEEYTPGFDQIDARLELAKARLHTDQLTGRIGQ